MKADSIKKMLIIEDNAGDARLLSEMLYEQNLHDIILKHVECMADAERYLALESVDIILPDLGLPNAQGLEAVCRAYAAAPRVPLVVLSGLDDESMAVQALKEGAQDYLIKGQIEPSELLRALHYSMERKTSKTACSRRRNALKPRLPASAMLQFVQISQGISLISIWLRRE